VINLAEMPYLIHLDLYMRREQKEHVKGVWLSDGSQQHPVHPHVGSTCLVFGAVIGVVASLSELSAYQHVISYRLQDHLPQAIASWPFVEDRAIHSIPSC